MKKIILLITILITAILNINVNAANYKLRELIPVNKETTIVTNNFSYKGLYYDNTTKQESYIIFKGIKNLTKENLPVSVSIGLFNEKKKNIGTVNYCSSNDDKSFIKDRGLDGKAEMSYTIKVDSNYLATDSKETDVKYISVLSDNINCRTTGAQDYVGQTIEKIGQPKNTLLDKDSKLLLTIVELIAAIVFMIFLYRFLFTNAFRNFDGEDVRQEYAYINKKLKEERKNNPQTKTKRGSKKSEKSPKIKRQEQEAKKKSKEETNLHDLYK